jgi:hypothetical protein
MVRFDLYIWCSITLGGSSMATAGSSYSVSTDHQVSSPLVNLGNVAGVCIMSNAWKVEQEPSLINFISAFLSANSFRLNFVSIPPVCAFFLCLDSFGELDYLKFSLKNSLYAVIGSHLQLWRCFYCFCFCD